MVAKEIDVDVQTRAYRAAQRVHANGKLSHSLHVPQPPKPQSFLERVLPHAERLMVKGREVSGFVVPHWAAGVLLASILGGAAFMYNQLGQQRDMLIRLDTQLQERNSQALEYRHKAENMMDLQQVYITNLDKQLTIIKSFLTQEQVKQLEKSTRKADN